MLPPFLLFGNNTGMRTPSPLTLRRATGADALRVARMHVAAWQAAYRGIVPGPFLDAMDVAARAARYTFDRRDPTHPETWIAVDGDEVVAMVSISPSRDRDLPGLGEIQALYVSPERWRSGAGSTLMSRAEALLRESGFSHALLWVLRDNARGRAFYEAAGWRADGLHKTIQIGGRDVVEVRYRKSLLDPAPAPGTSSGVGSQGA